MPNLSTPLKTLALILTLCGCSPTPESQSGSAPDLQVTYINPLNSIGPDQPTINSFDVYRDGANLHAVFTASTTPATLPYIGYIHSNDGGRHWSPVTDIGNTFQRPVESRAGNDIQIAASAQNLLVMWQTTGEFPGMGPLYGIFSLDGGTSWQAGANPTGTENDQSHQDLTADAIGHFHLVWLDDRDENGYQGLRYARSSDVGQHWELTQSLDDSSCSCCWNRLLIGQDNTVNVLFRDMEPRDMALALSANAGAKWRKPSRVGEFNWKFDGCPHNGGGLTQTADGILHASIWTGAENRVGLYHLLSVDGGLSWSAPQALAPGSAAFHSDIAALDKQRLAVIWDAIGPQGSTVFLAYSSDGGTSWSAPKTLSTLGSSGSFPRLLTTTDGWLAMWLEQKPQTPKQWQAAVIQ